MTKEERNTAIEAMINVINEDVGEVMKCFERAYEINDHDRFIQLSKRLDKLGELKAGLRNYRISMVGFGWIKDHMDMGDSQ